LGLRTVQSSAEKRYSKTMVIETVPLFIYLVLSVAGAGYIGHRFQVWVNS